MSTSAQGRKPPCTTALGLQVTEKRSESGTKEPQIGLLPGLLMKDFVYDVGRKFNKNNIIESTRDNIMPSSSVATRGYLHKQNKEFGPIFKMKN